MADTTYIVLLRATRPDDVPGSAKFVWCEHDTVEASSAESAIRKAIAGTSGGLFVAVPARSWRPVTVRTETQTVIRLDTSPAE
jgi:hypothetical protein